ncbi:MAG: lysophospholipid transporter LplT, partial [Comamonas sp.]
LSTKMGLSAFGAITVFGLLVAGTMVLIGLWHLNNRKKYPAELEKLLEVARRDCH